MYVGTRVTDQSGTFAVEIRTNNESAPFYRRGSDGKLFIVGRPGEAYTIHVHNLTGGRLEVVNAIDQRDTCQNVSANLSNRGMLVSPYGSSIFAGWRHNDDSVGQFVFGEPHHSISAQATGDTANVGIIGCAAFTEFVPAPIHHFPHHMYGLEAMRGPATMSAPSPATKGASRGGVGTGIGETISSHVTRVSFQRSSGAPAILEIGYDTEEWLLKQGLMAPAEPVAFPAFEAFAGYTRTPR